MAVSSHAGLAAGWKNIESVFSFGQIIYQTVKNWPGCSCPVAYEQSAPRPQLGIPLRLRM
jgi:hypothetical protein